MLRRGEIRPLPLHQAGQLHVVELAEAGAGAVQQVHAGLAGARRERLRFDPATADGGGIVELDR